jgi:ribosomal protein S18 acetylase RimI-like enzyme
MNCPKLDFEQLSKEILVEKGLCLRFQAKGWSMFPAIREGDILNIEPVKDKEISLGEVIFYQASAERIAAHRVIKKFFRQEKLILVAKGDSHTGRGEEVILEDVLGKVKLIERNGRKINLNRDIHKWIGIFSAQVSPLMMRLRQIGGMFLLPVQGLKVYRMLVKKIIRPDFIYQWEETNDDFENSFLATLSAMRKKTVVGTVTLKDSRESNPLDNGWWISGMWVNWRYRGLGIAKRMTEMTCDFAANQGACAVKLLVFRDNKPALGLYKKLGFARISLPGLDEELREEAKKFCREQIIMKKNIKWMRLPENADGKPCPEHGSL